MGSILVVDDERSIRVTVKAFLESDGHQAHAVEDARSAIAILEESPIDVVLTDIILPRLSGIELLKKIREISTDTLVIVMTGEPTLETASEALRLGAVDYLQKPVSKNAILRAVRNALALSKLHLEKKLLEEENLRYTLDLEQLVEERTQALAESEAALRCRAEDLSILNSLAREVGACSTIDATIRAGLKGIARATGPDFAVAFLRKEDELVPCGFFPEKAGRIWHPEVGHRVGECLCGIAVGEDLPIYSEDIRADFRCTMDECKIAGFSSFSALPLKIGAEILGVLGLASVSPRDFSSRGSFLEALANELSIGLKKNLLYEQLQHRAMELQASIEQIKETEAERLKLQNQLQQSQKMEAIGTLAGGIAHDFNNILAGVLGYTELALNCVQADTNVHRFLTQILEAGLRAKDLVSQVLTFSRDSKTVSGAVHLPPVVKEALRLLRASLPTTIDIHQNFQSELAVMADPTKIHQVLMNLCTNAAHAMQKNGGVLEVNLTDVDVDPAFAEKHPGLPPGSYVRLIVSDTGHGMSEFVRDRIFDPFFTTKEKGEGTGLGLSVVHGIVTGFDGHILVHSSPGKGTSFEIFLPAINADLEKCGEPGSIATGSEHILLVDDERTIVEAHKLMLESLGYRVTGESGSLKALNTFRAQPQEFDLVITDLTMPQLRGDELAKALLEIRPELPIILCTGFSTSIGEKNIAEIGFRALLQKPALKRDIAEAVRQVLDKDEGLGTGANRTRCKCH